MKDRIKKVRKDAKMTQAEFGEKIGITRTGLQKLETGENNPSEQTIRSICREFNIRRQWLEEGIEPMSVPADDQTSVFFMADMLFISRPEHEREAIRRMIAIPGGLKMLANFALFTIENLSVLAEGAQPDGKEE